MREKREKAKKRYLRLIQEFRLSQIISHHYEFADRLFERITKIEKKYPEFAKEIS